MVVVVVVVVVRVRAEKRDRLGRGRGLGLGWRGEAGGRGREPPSVCGSCRANGRYIVYACPSTPSHVQARSARSSVARNGLMALDDLAYCVGAKLLDKASAGAYEY